jgi:hypothetical protein
MTRLAVGALVLAGALGGCAIAPGRAAPMVAINQLGTARFVQVVGSSGTATFIVEPGSAVVLPDPQVGTVQSVRALGADCGILFDTVYGGTLSTSYSAGGQIYFRPDAVGATTALASQVPAATAAASTDCAP